MFGVKLLTFCGCGDGLSVGHGQRDGPHGAVVWRRSQNWGEVTRDLSHHLTAAVRLQVRQEGDFRTRVFTGGMIYSAHSGVRHAD